MNSFSPFSPVDIRILTADKGEGAVRTMLTGEKKKILVLTTSSLCTRLSLASFFTALQGDGHCLHLAADVAPTPSVEDVTALLQRLRQQEFDPTIILAIGGGSVLDMAKAISAFWHLPEFVNADDIRNAIHTKAYWQSPAFVDWIAMPTTAGTGSEVTPWATIWDPQKARKLSIDSPGLFAKAAVILPKWTSSMPPALTLATGLDVLSHAMESFWANMRTPLSQALSLRAIETARVALPKAIAHPQSDDARQDMCVASLLAGLALSLTRTTACHSISYPLTMFHGVPHGIAAALTLGEVMTRNREAVPEIAQIENLFTEDSGFACWLASVSENTQPLRLSAFGIEEKHLPAIVDLTFTQGRMDNNPVLFTPDDVLEILHACF